MNNLSYKGGGTLLKGIMDDLSIHDCDSIVTIDLGEDNDLHPQAKRELGRRLALLAAKLSCGLDVECIRLRK